MGMKPRPKKFRYIVCETEAVITWHLRKLPEGKEPNYSGYADVETLCGLNAAWDTKTHLNNVSCRTCMAKKKEWRSG